MHGKNWSLPFHIMENGNPDLSLILFIGMMLPFGKMDWRLITMKTPQGQSPGLDAMDL